MPASKSNGSKSKTKKKSAKKPIESYENAHGGRNRLVARAPG